LKFNKYYSAAIAAFIIWGFFPIALKALSNHPSGQILYYRILTSCISIILLSLLFRRKEFTKSISIFKSSDQKEQKRFAYLTLAAGLLMTINWLVFIYVINHISIQTGSFSYLVCPIITAVLGYLLLKETLAPNQWIAIILSSISCILLGTGSFLNLGYSLLIASSYAFYLITQKLLKDYDKIFLLTLQLIIACIIVMPFYTFFNGGAGVDLYFFSVIVLISLLFTVLPLFLSLFALKEMPSGAMGILMYINPVLNFIIAFLYYQEKASNNQLWAYSMISLSLILYNLNFSKAKVLPIP
jgi:chloramphenicol-sensitive protein RarD